MINGFTRALTVELRTWGIRANASSPVALTDMSQTVIDRLGQLSAASGVQAEVPAFPPAEDVARLVSYLASDDVAHLSGQIFEFDGRELSMWSHPEQVGHCTRAALGARGLRGLLRGRPAAAGPPPRALGRRRARVAGDRRRK